MVKLISKVNSNHPTGHNNYIVVYISISSIVCLFLIKSGQSASAPHRKVLNFTLNAHKSTELVLFADDTNIFVKAGAYEKANTILEFVNLYTITNKLLINLFKSCFIDFKSEKNSPLPNDELNFLIQNIEVKRVTKAKFLEVTIDKNLNCNSHLYKNFSCTTGIFNTIKDNIPDDLHKSLYHTLFESHLTYGITVWEGVTTPEKNV